MRMYNLYGQLILKITKGDLPQMIDVQHLEKGVYVVEIDVSNSVVSKKIIVN